MERLPKIIPALFVPLLLTSCAYQAGVQVAPAYNIYSSFNNEVPGNWALYVDIDEFGPQEFKFDGFNCSAHKFPMDLSSTFAQSAIRTVENIVENVQLVDRALNTDQLRSQNLDGLIILEGQKIDVKLRYIAGFWTSEAEADVELTVSVLVDGREGRLLGTTVSEDADAEKPIGSFCSGGAEALGEATSEAVQKTLERVAERIANSERMRQSNISLMAD